MHGKARRRRKHPYVAVMSEALCVFGERLVRTQRGVIRRQLDEACPEVPVWDHVKGFECAGGVGPHSIEACRTVRTGFVNRNVAIGEAPVLMVESIDARAVTDFHGADFVTEVRATEIEAVPGITSE